MTQIKNNINTYADLTAYNADLNKEFPNVSYIEGTDEVKWVKEDPTLIVAKYNVTSTTSATTLVNTNSGITYQIIDGVQQQSVQTTYTFDTLGEHTVKYKLNGTSIGNNAFNGCSSLTSITIPNSVTSIGDNAFYQCSGLTSITIPDSVTRIESYTFARCNSLLSINIPSGVTYIGDSAFFYCSGLTSITVNATTPPTLVGNNVFDYSLVPIYVPAASVNAYKAASKWDEYASFIQAIPNS